jgi:hypothetical protein
MGEGTFNQQPASGPAAESAVPAGGPDPEVVR